jgi:hypothetical protein
MARKKMDNPETVTTILEEEQHRKLQILKILEKKPMAEMIREAIQKLIEEKEKIHPIMKTLKI